MIHSPPTLRRLTPDLQEDFLQFFEGAAFADNPTWKSCCCQFLHVDHSKVDWKTRTAEASRAAACHRIGCGRMQGLQAYRDGQVVGWCNAAPRAWLDAFADEPDPQAEVLGQIACFEIARDHRRSGVAKALLASACDMLGEQGPRVAEATPSRSAATDAEPHHGPLSLYLAAGFTIHREEADGVVVGRKAKSGISSVL